VGGGTHSEYWLRALATTLEVPLMLPDAAELGGAFGAARLGMMAATGDLSIANEPPVARVVEPDFALTEAFREAHESHRKAAAFLKDYS
ncbi:MAG: xylulokinase, partial [Boseongicola sp.]|nr:xylulokinase [Boseongicola sp.]